MKAARQLMNQSLKTALLAAFALLLGVCSASVQAAWDLAELMQGLAQNKSGRASFVETKYIAMLDKPVESSGELLFTAPGRLEKRTFKPKPESVLIENGTLTVERGKRRNVLRLQDYPELVAFTESIRGTLAGDTAALKRIYALDLEGSQEEWTLSLRPIDAKMQELVKRIRIGGSHADVKSFEVEQTDKDRSVMVIENLSGP